MNLEPEFKSSFDSKSPAFLKPRKIIGNDLLFRNASVDDAAFTLGLRTDANKSKYISKTQLDIKYQLLWLERYSEDESQIYFIIQNKDNEDLGTVRLYDQQGESFCWGSWIIKDGCPSSFAIESALMVYHFALSLGFNKAHFDVRKGNSSVWRFHERFGAIRIGESTDDYSYRIEMKAITNSLERFRKFLPNGIDIEYPLE